MRVLSESSEYDKTLSDAGAAAAAIAKKSKQHRTAQQTAADCAGVLAADSMLLERGQEGASAQTRFTQSSSPF